MLQWAVSVSPVDFESNQRVNPLQPGTNGRSPEGAVRNRSSSSRRYQTYRNTARELDRQSRRKDISDDQLAERAKELDKGGKVTISRRRSASRSRGFMKLLSEFWALMGNQRRRVIGAIVAGAIATGLGLLPFYAPKLVIDFVMVPPDAATTRPEWLTFSLRTLGLSGDSRVGLLWAVVLASLTIAFINLGIGLWSRWQATKASKRIVVSARKQAFDHAVRLPLHRVYDIKSGGVASVLRDDAGGVGELVFSMLYNPSKAIVQLVGSLVFLAWIEWRLLLGAVVILPVVWLTHKTWISRIRPLWRDIRHTRTAIDAHATESFGGMRVVRTFNRQRSESGSFTENNHLMARQELYAWWWMRGIDSAWQVIIPAATALLLLFGGYLGMKTNVSGDPLLSAGDLTTFLAFLLGMLQPIAMLANSATGLQNNLAGLDRTLDLLEEPQEFASGSNHLPLDRDKVRGHITLENVHYAYPKQSGDLGEAQTELGLEVLRGVNLDVEPGTVVAFIGPSGAGKTTLCNLIARFYDPTRGCILLDGTDLRDIDIDDYRSLLGIVEQDTFLFDGTIAQNIAYGSRSATRSDVVEAAKLANAHEFIEKFPESYNAFIGERGVKLSGGQRQRITIARALLADPKILILDEATSNLDTQSERLIQTSLSKLMRGRTCFVIAHRLSTIQSADLIAVVDHGTILETGTHDELMQRSGRYQEMVQLQTSPPAPVEEEEREEVVEAVG